MKRKSWLNIKMSLALAAVVCCMAACGRNDGTVESISQVQETISGTGNAEEQTEDAKEKSQEETTEITGTETAAQTDEEVDDTAAAGQIVLTDQAGREVVLDAPAESIVSSYYITTYATMVLGVSDHVIGLENQADIRPLYHMAAPELMALPNVGTLKEFNIEAIAALEPDLVLIPMKRREDADTLTDLGITTLVVDPETQENLEEMLTLIAEACGVEERAEALIAYYHETMDELRELTEGLDRPTVYLGSNSSQLRTAPKDMFQSNLIELGGGENVAGNLEGNYWVEVSYETVLAMNPEVFIIPSAAVYTKEDILNDPQLADLDAVKNGRVYAMPSELDEWDSPIPSSILGAMWMTSVLHEEQYPMETFKTDAAAFYKEFYGFDMDQNLITK